jgi:hypothetical protein
MYTGKSKHIINAMPKFRKNIITRAIEKVRNVVKRLTTLPKTKPVIFDESVDTL